jgi:hypothetical protein
MISVTACPETGVPLPPKPAGRRRRAGTRAAGEDPTFQIDPAHHGLPISSLPFSTRARNILASSQVKTLGDLHGAPLGRVRDARNCGTKSFLEMLRVLAPYVGKGGLPGAPRKPSTPEKPFSVPETARGWPLKLLPISARLEHVLTRLKMAKLGDLHGVDPASLEAAPDCGVRTATEIRELLGRIQRGEFGKPRESTSMSPSLFLVTRIDEFVDSLPEPRREILCRRLGATDTPWTLMKIGQKFGMTRERVRQIVNLLADEALRFGGPPMAATLDEMADELVGKVLPLTPRLLEERLGPAAAKRRFGLVFHARMIELLCPRMPAWPEGPEPAAHRARESEAILQTLVHWVRVHPAPTPFATVLAGIREEGFTCSPAAFLQALRHAVPFALDFADPEKPTLAPGRRGARRWTPGEEAKAPEPSPAGGVPAA